MGLLTAGASAVNGVLADQWKEYFYCDALPENVMVAKGQKRGSKLLNRGSDNVISNGSVVAVADGQCMMIVDNGKVVELCAQPGEFIYDSSSEPSIFAGGLNRENLMAVLSNVGRRFTFGGNAGKDQRVYYFNTKELTGNKYGTPSAVPFRVVDERAGIDMDIGIRCFGEYSYRIANPILFYTNVCGNVTDVYDRSTLDGQLKSELLTALQPAFARISEQGIRYSALAGHTEELADAMNTVLDKKWGQLRGLEIVSMGVSSVSATEEDEATIKQMQQDAAYLNPARGAAAIAGATARSMQDAAKNPAGAINGFMGMDMAQRKGGVNANDLYAMAAQQQAQQAQQMQQMQQTQAAAAPAADTWQCPNCHKTVAGRFCPECGTKKPEPKPADGWTCSKCGTANTGKFCKECGSPKPAENGWTCPSCGTFNQGKFCKECGTKKPAGTPQYRCDKCGWKPEDPAHPPKFCPECGDPFDDADLI